MNKNSNISLLEIIDDKPKVSHRIIALHTDNKEETVSRLIRRYLDKLELFGQVGFKIQTVTNSAGAVNEEKTFYLNEPQATLLLTFLRNNDIVVIFKVELVKQFFEMREKLQNPILQFPNFSEILSVNEEALKVVELFKSSSSFDLLLLQKLLKEKSISSLFQLDFSQTYFLPTEIGKLHGLSPVETNLELAHRGFQEKENGIWKLTESGKEFGMEFGGKFSQLKWKLETLFRN
jgi:phage regulator Rha-like protein